MNRRDFLLLRQADEQQIAQLSCEKLYMYYSDSLAVKKTGTTDSGIDHDAQWWSGEPSSVIANLDADSLFASLAEELIEADVLVVKDKQWIVDGEFANLINALFSRFVDQGGNIKFHEDAA